MTDPKTPFYCRVVVRRISALSKSGLFPNFQSGISYQHKNTSFTLFVKQCNISLTKLVLLALQNSQLSGSPNHASPSSPTKCRIILPARQTRTPPPPRCGTSCIVLSTFRHQILFGRNGRLLNIYRKKCLSTVEIDPHEIREGKLRGKPTFSDVQQKKNPSEGMLNVVKGTTKYGGRPQKGEEVQSSNIFRCATK